MRSLPSIVGLLCVGVFASGDAAGQAVTRSRDLNSSWTSPAALPPATTSAAAWPSAPATGSAAWPSSTPATSPPPLLGSTQSGFVPSWNSQPNGWRIGVAVENSETGVVLTDVERGSPADRAGIARGDAIINVEGYQVGYVNGSLFDLGDELQKRADPQGRVDLLIFNNRNRQIAMTPVQLTQQSAAGVSGQVVCRERITLSPQAALTVRLRDVTYANWQNVTVGQQVIPNPPHPPISFSIQVDPASFYPDHRYAIDAWLEDRGQIVLQSSAPVPVDPKANAAALQVTLVRTSPSAPPGNVYAVGQLQQISQWYRQYLGREASQQELAAWQSYLQSGQPPQNILAYILGSSEYYDRLGNQRDRFLSSVYTTVNGRPPTSADLQQYVDRYGQYNGARSQFVQDQLRFVPNGQLQ